MPIVDSQTGKIKTQYTFSKLLKTANLMRAYCLTSLYLAGSGHTGGIMSVMDIAAALYLVIAKHDPTNPDWPDRDRIIWSGGHKAPALYTALAMSGYFPIEKIATLRKFQSPFQGHPDSLVLKGVEVSTGSLGQGLGVAVGIALAAKLNKKDFKTYVISGDGEWQEGSMWEAAMSAAHHKLNNLILIIDRNKLQIDGTTDKIMKISPMDEKLKSFEWKVLEVDGHDMIGILKALTDYDSQKPLAIIAKTVKGKGSILFENQTKWHGKTPNKEELLDALDDLKISSYEINLEKMEEIAQKHQEKIESQLRKNMPHFSQDYGWNKLNIMKVSLKANRDGFGEVLAENGDDQRIVCLGLDISESVRINKFYENHDERVDRYISIGIAEQNATSVAAGLAKEGKLPIMATYGVFCSQRNADQMRTSVCYQRANVFFAGAHGGISVGPDGGTHQSLEEFAVVGFLPNMTLVCPADFIETKKATYELLFNVNGPKYLRFGREIVPEISNNSTPFILGQANVIRFRGEKENFIDSFETKLARDYDNENEEVAIIACGSMVAESMRSAWILKNDFGIETRVVNMHTIKPLDRQAIIDAAKQVEIIITAEEHQKGGLGNLVASVILEAGLENKVKFARIGVEDKFGQSGKPWELMQAYGLTAEHIAKKVISFCHSRQI